MTRCHIDRKIYIALFCVCTWLFTTYSANAEPAGDVTTFLVVRHAEREGTLDELSKSGEERAKILASLARALNVQAIYSTNTKRTRSTAQPLAEAAELEINLYRSPSENWIAALHKKHKGQVVLIVGHSNTAGVIAGRLADENPYKLDHDEYNALFVVRITKAKTKSMRLDYGS